MGVCYQYRTTAGSLLDCKKHSRTTAVQLFVARLHVCVLQSMCKGALCGEASIEWYPGLFILALFFSMPDQFEVYGALHRQE